MKFNFSVESHIEEIEGSASCARVKWLNQVKLTPTLSTLPTLPTCPTPELSFFMDVGLNPYSDLTAPERIEARRQQLLEMMEEDDQARAYYFLTDTETHPDYVILAMAKRGAATWEFSIEKERYDVGVLLDLIRRIEADYMKGITHE